LYLLRPQLHLGCNAAEFLFFFSGEIRYSIERSSISVMLAFKKKLTGEMKYVIVDGDIS